MLGLTRSKRGAPQPASGLLRPVGRGRDSTARLLPALPLAPRARRRSQAHRPMPAPLTPPAPRERQHSMAQRFAIMPPRPASRALAPGLAKAQRFAFARPCAHKPDAEHRACKIPIRPDNRRSSGSPAESSCPAPTVAGEGMPLATARSCPRRRSACWRLPKPLHAAR